MWFVFGMSLAIAFLWGAKMIIRKRFEIRKTPLDIPILLFLLSQIISTVLSVDQHTSFWGYYSRFNGGLLSTISYIFLYYAFATNLVKTDDENERPISYFLLTISLLAGLVVTLWGIPSHFGVDFTCLFFRGSPDTSCWTASFQPTVRIFSTLGQPNWLGTYLAALIPIALGFGFLKLADKNKLSSILYLLLSFLFFVALLFSRSQSSFVGLAVGMIFFLAVLIFKNLNHVKKIGKNNFSKYLIAIVAVFLVTNFLIGDPVNGLNKITTLNGLQSIFVHKQITNAPTDKGDAQASDIRIGGSESGDIRLIVWQGALKLFQEHPLFGTGVETFAYTYYGVKPLAHNLTSEWDYLYNKAHNEYLNYLATTGIFGLGTYLLFIGFFYFYVVKQILRKSENEYFPISIGIAGGFLAMLVSNFFGFSVVVINLFIFTFPIFFLDLENRKSLKKVFAIPKTYEEKNEKIYPFQTIGIVVLLLIALYYEFFLFNFWRADQKYALGYNLDHASEYGQGYQPLADAVKMLPQEDLYKDELSINMATISLLLADQKSATEAAAAGQQAKALSDYVNQKHPNNIVYLKTRARVFFALSEIDPTYLDQAIATIEQARQLAPTDAKLAYNEGLFYQQKEDLDNAVKYINQAISLKPNYGDAYYSLALIYGDLAKKNPAQAAEFREKEKDALTTILTKIDPSSKQASDLLKTL